MDWQDFIDIAQKVAQEENFKNLGVLLGQAAQETGRNPYNAPGHNWFGIKGTGNGGSSYQNTWEDYGGGRVNTSDQFAGYQSPADAIKAYIDWVSQHVPNYNDLSPEQLITAIKGAGYATDPNYIASVMNTPEFKQYYQTQPQNITTNQPGLTPMTPTAQPKPHNIFDTIKNYIAPQAYADFDPTNPGGLKNYSFNQNWNNPMGGSDYTVKPGDTLWGIAQQYLGNGNRWHELGGYTGSPTALPVGQRIQLPSIKNYSPAPSRPASSPSPAPNYSSPSGPAYAPPPASVARQQVASSLPTGQFINYSPVKTPAQQNAQKTVGSALPLGRFL